MTMDRKAKQAEQLAACSEQADKELFESALEEPVPAWHRNAESSEHAAKRKRQGAEDATKNKGFYRPFRGLEKLKTEGKKRAGREQVSEGAKPANASSGAKPASCSADEDGNALFRSAVAGTRPLSSPASIPAEKRVQKRPTVDNSEEAEVMAELADLVSGRAGFDFRYSDEHIEGIAEGLDRKLLKKLKKGAFSFKRHLDLHGYNRADAKVLLQRFIRQCRLENERCVLVVHGRGLHSKDGIPVLKDAVNSWLLRGGLSRNVLAFCSARPQDGGLGALYVLLRR
jgi:DNA-nicking Smr family endonuclease